VRSTLTRIGSPSFQRIFLTMSAPATATHAQVAEGLELIVRDHTRSSSLPNSAGSDCDRRQLILRILVIAAD